MPELTTVCFKNEHMHLNNNLKKKQSPAQIKYSEMSHPLVIRGMFRLILHLILDWLSGHRQAIELGHLQRTHLLHL